MLDPSIQAQLPLVTELLKAHKIKSAYAFGSVLGNKFTSKSDVDLLITFEDGLEPLEIGEIWWKLHDSLRDVFKREVDLLIESSLKNPYLIEEINERKQLIYGA